MKPIIKIEKGNDYEITATYPTFPVKGYGDTIGGAISDLLESLEFTLKTAE